MMFLFTTTITASFFDSLNPSAIVQQMLLQAMVKRKKDVLYFILGISLANMLMGIAIYYGISSWIMNLLETATQAYPILVYGTELIIGIVIIIITIRLFKTKIFIDKDNINEITNIDNDNQLTPLSLFIMGATFCIVELTSALPYFGFLAILTSYDLSVIFVLCFITLYTLIYALPLIVLYIGYNKLQDTILIRRIEYYLNKISQFIIPVALLIISSTCILHSIYSLL